MFRQFRHIWARLILEKQDDLRMLEEELDDMDTNDGKGGIPTQNLTTRYRSDPDEAKKRRELFDRLETAFKEYADLIEAVHKLTSLDVPSKLEYQNLQNFVVGYKPVAEDETEWATLKRNQADLVTLRGARQFPFLAARLEVFVHRMRKVWHTIWDPLVKLVNSAVEGDLQLTDKEILLKWMGKNKLVENAVRSTVWIFLMAASLALLVVPIYTLSILDRTEQNVKERLGTSIAVLIAFAIAFIFLLATATRAENHEVVSSAAAYLAVLVVFFGTVGP